MSGISLSTALEIFTQPDDLEFCIGQVSDKYAFAINRGPGHNCKLLLSADPVFATQEAAAKAIKDLLTGICTHMTAELATESSFAAQMLNAEGMPMDDAHVLSGKYREQIYADLIANGVARTCTYKDL